MMTQKDDVTQFDTPRNSSSSTISSSFIAQTFYQKCALLCNRLAAKHSSALYNTVAVCPQSVSLPKYLPPSVCVWLSVLSQSVSVSLSLSPSVCVCVCVCWQLSNLSVSITVCLSLCMCATTCDWVVCCRCQDLSSSTWTKTRRRSKVSVKTSNQPGSPSSLLTRRRRPP